MKVKNIDCRQQVGEPRGKRLLWVVPFRGRSRKADGFALGILAVSGVLYLQNLGAPHIQLWDEAIHANVVQNLADHCCAPVLHRYPGIGRDYGVSADFAALRLAQRPAVGTDYHDWTNNTIWLHKPLFPFYLAAGIYSLLGKSLWALRLPGAIFSLLTAWVVYLIGRRFLGVRAGLCGAAVFGLNPYTDRLVHGREFSGLPDLACVFFTSLAVYLILSWTEQKARATMRLIGLAIGLGYLCKGGLALAPLAVLAGVIVWSRGMRGLAEARPAIIVCALVILPLRLCWLLLYPAQFRYEESVQFLHLVRSIEEAPTTWGYYLADAYPRILSVAVVPLAILALAWGLSLGGPGQPGFILSIWVVAYLLPLSLAVSKVDNFIFPTLPAVAVLIPHALISLFRKRGFTLIVALCSSSVILCILWRVNHGDEQLSTFTSLAGCATFVLVFCLLGLLRFQSQLVTSGALALVGFAVLTIYVERDISPNREPVAGPGEESIRQSGTKLRQAVNNDSLILYTNSSLDHAYLYLMYWSGADVLDVCMDPRPSDFVAGLRGRSHVYLVTDRPVAAAVSQRLPIGNLYSLQETPFDDWSVAAVEACQSR